MSNDIESFCSNQMSECFFECPTADREREKERVVISGMGVRGGSPFVVREGGSPGELTHSA